MININIGKCDDIAPEIIQFLIDHGLIVQNLIGYERTEYGCKACEETFAEYQKQKADTKTGPSGKNDFHSEKRDSFSSDDDLTVYKRKPLDPTPTKAKPQTKYKKQG